MTESESVALPLGDTPIFSTQVIIAEPKPLVNSFLKKVCRLCNRQCIFLRTVHRGAVADEQKGALSFRPRKPTFFPPGGKKAEDSADFF